MNFTVFSHISMILSFAYWLLAFNLSANSSDFIFFTLLGTAAYLTILDVLFDIQPKKLTRNRSGHGACDPADPGLEADDD